MQTLPDLPCPSHRSLQAKESLLEKIAKRIVRTSFVDKNEGHTKAVLLTQQWSKTKVGKHAKRASAFEKDQFVFLNKNALATPTKVKDTSESYEGKRPVHKK